MKALLHIIRHHPAMALAFIVGLMATSFFAYEMVSEARHWKSPEGRNQAPQVWMTPMFIAHSWNVDPRALGEALGLTERPKKRTTLEDIAKARGVPVTQVIAEVQAFLALQSPERSR